MYETTPGADSKAPLPPVLSAVSAILVEPRVLVGRSARELLDTAAACQALVTQAQVLEAEAIAALEADPTDEAYTGPPVGTTPPGPEVVSTHELALVLGVSIETARNKRYIAQQVTANLPLVLGATRSGVLPWWQVRRVQEAVSSLGPEAVARVDERIAAAAEAGRCRSRFGPLVARAVLAAAPDLAEQQHVEAMSERTIWFRPAEHGMTAFGGLLPAEGAVTVAACLTRLARTPVAAPPVSCDADGRSMDQARADGFVGICGQLLEQLLAPPGAARAEQSPALEPGHVRPDRSGRAATAGQAGSARFPAAGSNPTTDPTRGSSDHQTSTRRARLSAARRSRRRAARATDRLSGALDRMLTAGLLSEVGLAADGPSPLLGALRSRGRRPTGEIRVTVSAETLLGISQAPAELDGYGPITAGSARRLAHRAGTTWRRLLTDPTTGAILDVGRTRYRPPEALADHIRTRYGDRCDRPGCAHRVADLDHILDWESGGHTDERNLHAVCRGCHTARHTTTPTAAGSSPFTRTSRSRRPRHTDTRRAPSPPTTGRRTACSPALSARQPAICRMTTCRTVGSTTISLPSERIR